MPGRPFPGCVLGKTPSLLQKGQLQNLSGACPIVKHPRQSKRGFHRCATRVKDAAAGCQAVADQNSGDSAHALVPPEGVLYPVHGLILGWVHAVSPGRSLVGCRSACEHRRIGAGLVDFYDSAASSKPQSICGTGCLRSQRKAYASTIATGLDWQLTLWGRPLLDQRPQDTPNPRHVGVRQFRIHRQG